MPDCTAETLVADSKCLACGMSQKQLLAALLYVLCTSNSMTCTAESLVNSSKCYCGMNERQLLASLLYVLCTNGGTGGGAVQVLSYVADPNTEAITPANPALEALAYKSDGTGPIFVWNTSTLTWV